MADHRTVMINLRSPWDDDHTRSETCASVDDRLDEVSAEGWVLVATDIIQHAGSAHLRVLMATFRKGKPR